MDKGVRHLNKVIIHLTSETKTASQLALATTIKENTHTCLCSQLSGADLSYCKGISMNVKDTWKILQAKSSFIDLIESWRMDI